MIELKGSQIEAHMNIIIISDPSVERAASTETRLCAAGMKVALVF